MNDSNDLKTIEKNLDKIRSFIEDPNSEVSEEIIEKSKLIIKLIESDTWFRRNFFYLTGILFIFLSIIFYNWDDTKFYLLYILRLFIILVYFIFKFNFFYN